MGKKGIEAGFLVVTLLTIISFIFIAGTVQRVLSDSDEKQAERICHDSIALRAAMTIRVNDKEFTPPTPPLCKTIDKVIKDDKKEKIMQQFADKMARCWWMFGEGRYEQILDDPKFGLNFGLLIEKAFGLPKGGNNCFQCYTMRIAQDEIKDGSITVQEMGNYLSQTSYPKVKEKKYLEYIQSYGGPGSVAIVSKIEPQNVYSLLFFSKNKKGSGSWWTAKAVPIAAAWTAFCVATGGSCLLLAAGTGTLTGTALGKGILEIFRDDERDVSIIALTDLKSAEQYGCVSDIAGE